MLDQSNVRNCLLAHLSAEDFAALAQHLVPVDLHRDFVLAIPNTPIVDVFFIESGMVSVVAEKAAGRCIEVGVYGRDGTGPSTVLLGSDQTPHHQYMRIAGSGLQISTKAFLEVVEQRPAVRNLMLRFIHVFMTHSLHWSTEVPSSRNGWPAGCSCAGTGSIWTSFQSRTTSYR